MNVNETKYWIWLTMIFGVGSRRIWEAMRLFETAEEAYQELSSGAFSDRLSDDERRSISAVDIDKAVEHINLCSGKGISIAGYSDPEYPPQLRHILNPPPVLYYKGNLRCLCGTKTVASVGARKSSPYSINAAERICRELALNGVTVISGFAVGIDIASHLAAVYVNRPTACILGCGIDVDYPRENFRFREEIIANGGVFLSEFPLGTSPLPGNFPKRNRILAALARVTIVFEASRRSGSLITASLALEQGRDIFCLPPADIFSEQFSGNVMLLRDGAYALYSAADVMDCFRLGGANDSEIRNDNYRGISTFGVGELVPIRKNPRKTDTEKKKKLKPADDKTDAAADAPTVPEFHDEAEKPETKDIPREELTELQNRIIDEILAGTAHADAIAAEISVDAVQVSSEITELELLGILRMLPGNTYEIC